MGMGMEEIELAADDPKPLVGWSLRTAPCGGLVMYLEYAEPLNGLGSLTLAIPSQAILPLAEELARSIAAS
jgi:hypothetical protein